METFASPADYVERYPDDDVGDRLATLLGDAAAYIVGYLSGSDVRVDPDDQVQRRNLTSVCCSVVHRRVTVPEDMVGVKQWSTTAGPFTQSGTWSNPTEDMYLTASERRLLGIGARGGRGRLLSIPPDFHGRRCG